MSSTGIISDVIVGAPTTSLGEAQRTSQNQMASMPGLQSSIQMAYGVISEVHDTKPLIKAVTDDGRYICSNKWILLSHSLDEIVARFGRIRKGMRVQISYTGPDGAQATALIVGVEGEKQGDGTQLENKVQKSLYAIFTPGSSSGG